MVKYSTSQHCAGSIRNELFVYCKFINVRRLNVWMCFWDKTMFAMINICSYLKSVLIIQVHMNYVCGYLFLWFKDSREFWQINPLQTLMNLQYLWISNMQFPGHHHHCIPVPSAFVGQYRCINTHVYKLRKYLVTHVSISLVVCVILLDHAK